VFADPSRGFAPAPPVGSHGTIMADTSRGFAPVPPVGSLGTVFADPNRVYKIHHGFEGTIYKFHM